MKKPLCEKDYSELETAWFLLGKNAIRFLFASDSVLIIDFSKIVNGKHILPTSVLKIDTQKGCFNYKQYQYDSEQDKIDNYEEQEDDYALQRYDNGNLLDGLYTDDSSSKSLQIESRKKYLRFQIGKKYIVIKNGKMIAMGNKNSEDEDREFSEWEKGLYE